MARSNRQAEIASGLTGRPVKKQFGTKRQLLVGARGHDSSQPQKEFGGLTISPSGKRAIRRMGGQPQLLSRKGSPYLPPPVSTGEGDMQPSVQGQINNYKKRQREEAAAKKAKAKARAEQRNEFFGVEPVRA